MKRLSGLALVVAAQAALAQQLPFETDAFRHLKIDNHKNLVIKNAKILTATHGTIERGDILVQNGKIAAIGKVNAPAGTMVIDATGKVVSPGIVDAHIHRGLDATNEGTDAITAEGRVLDVINPDAKNVWQAVASGETAGLVLHGSANPVGAQSLVVKLKYGHAPQEMPVMDAPRMIKFALGENVTRSGQNTATRFPHTRMGVEAVYRRGFTEAREYLKKWQDYRAAKEKDPNAKAPQRDLRLETLSDILQRKIWVQCHSYRADEILMLVRLSKEFGFKIGAMQHALESYKIAPELAKAGVGVSIFEDDWAGKLELYDCIPYAASILSKAGVNVSINTDGTSGTTAINLDAAKTMRFGGLTEQQALDLITINPAKELGIAHRTGSIDVGKDADLVIWDGHPLSTYSRVNTTIIEGEILFQRADAFGVNASSTIKTSLDPFTYIPDQPMPKKANAYAIRNATVYTGTGAVLSNATVVMESGKVKAVGQHVAIPAGATVINGRGLNVYPGFIDAGSTIGLTEFGQVGQATDAREFGTFQPDLIALTAVQVQSEHIPTTRSQGVLTAVTSPRGGSISGQASIINMTGWTNEQMGLRKNAGLYMSWPGGGGFGNFNPDVDEEDDDGDGHGADMGGGQGFGGQGGGGTTADDLTAYFDKAIAYGKKHDTVDLGLEAMQPYVNGKLPVFIRARNAAAIRAAVDFINDYKIKGVLVDAPDAWKEAKLLAKNHIPVILTPAGASTLGANTTVSDWDPYDTPYALPALLKRAGVKFCFQSDGYATSINLPQRVAESCAYGLSRSDAIRALTLSAAEILGIQQSVGSIERGKFGNIVISDGDPFEMTSNIRYVFIDGQPVSLASKFTRLRDQYMQRVK